MKKVIHKYDALSRRILGEYGQYQFFAADAKISHTTLNRKLDGLTSISTEEMFRWCQLLRVEPFEIPLLFDVSGTMRKVMSA